MVQQALPHLRTTATKQIHGTAHVASVLQAVEGAGRLDFMRFEEQRFPVSLIGDRLRIGRLDDLVAIEPVNG